MRSNSKAVKTIFSFFDLLGFILKNHHHLLHLLRSAPSSPSSICTFFTFFDLLGFILKSDTKLPTDLLIQTTYVSGPKSDSNDPRLRV
ncbi:hypothetical protein L2E82_49447 [Cichorium intybus]|uniref:Uncharacterized protein n=1 Tax=Cichorium intybus TaxID=13427 RepID=A0ACB8Z1X4_CICIN|nr:hypothetical protein L2E82_49447 [Cichorium intybus]